MRQRMVAETALPEIVAGLVPAGGRDRCAAFAQHLAGALGAPMALVLEIGAERDSRLAGSWARDGRTVPLLDVGPATAGSRLLAEGALLHPRNVRSRYPADASLARLGAESLAGRVLRDAAGAPAGLIAVLDTAPLGWTPVADAVLSIFASAAEQELLRSRTEQRLSQLARKWTATLDAIPDLVAVIDPDFRLLRVNRALARIARAHPRDLIGCSCHRVFHGLDHPWPGCPHQLALQDGRSVSREIVDPAIGRPLLVTCTPFFDEDGVLLGTIHVARDITEQQEATRLRENLVGELQEALARVKLLSGLLPICSVCKSIRDDEGYWEQIEVFLRNHSEAEFTHGLCPACATKLYPAFYKPT